jgi:hypothetical protein
VFGILAAAKLVITDFSLSVSGLWVVSANLKRTSNGKTLVKLAIFGYLGIWLYQPGRARLRGRIRPEMPLDFAARGRGAWMRAKRGPQATVAEATARKLNGDFFRGVPPAPVRV